MLAASAAGGEPNDPNQSPRSVTAVIIPCKDMIDDGLYRSIKRRSELALGQGADYLIFEIQTYGGLVDAADNISKYLILDIGKRARTVAYVTTEAISAGAMISVSCQDIIMLENTTIGDCAPIVMGGTLEGVEREKAESFIRAIFSRAAEANGYPEPLLKAMVSVQTEVYRVKNLETGEYEFYETDFLPTDANDYDLANKELIVRAGELLTLTASKAEEYGIARAVVKNEQGVLDFLSERDGVTFKSRPEVLPTIWSEEMVRWINSPVVMSILVLIALLGVYIELNTPGVGLPGLVALICFVIIIASKYLVGLANWVEIAIFTVGIILLLIEIFVIPGFGVAGILGIIFIIAGIFGMLIKNTPDELPWPHTPTDWDIFADGVLGLSIGFIAFLALAWVLGRYLPKLEFLSGLVLSPGQTRQGTKIAVSMTAPPESRGAALSIGDIGEVVSRLRPAGRARFADRVIDVVATAEFLDIGQKVEIIEIHGNRVVVKRREKN
jgi:membrane-bound serine protease (ClpP class)